MRTIKIALACLMVFTVLCISSESQTALARTPVGSTLVATTLYFPAVFGSPTSPATGAIVVDHTTADLGKIPDTWIAEAKKLTFHFAHTSHGSQINTGMAWLEGQDSKYAVAIQYGGTPPTLPSKAGAIRIYDGNNYGSDAYIVPEMYWSTEDGLTHTRQVASTSLFGFSMWAWCGQQSSNFPDVVNQYLAALNQLEGQYPSMRFIYMTGHTDGGSATLTQNNNAVRAYVLAHGKVLYDFANIESYDPAGTYYSATDDSCPWCTTWCSTHSSECAALASMGDCAHSHKYNCKLKAQAFWWMLARLAGWSCPTP